MNSILSFPERGNYGSAKYRGNVSGHVIKSLLDHFRPALACDPAEGGRTMRDVVREMKREGHRIDFVGLDLKAGFNLLKDELRDHLPRECDYLFFHPPYHSLIPYSGHVWGTEPHPDDLSHCRSYADFLAKLQMALHNCYRGIRRGGNYSILVGDIRKNGDYFCLAADLRPLAPGKLTGVLIKEQFNCVSDARSYKGDFIKIAHEYILNFKKDNLVFGMLDCALATSEKLQMLSNANWRAITESALQRLGGRAPLQDIYRVIEETATHKTAGRPNWTAKVRQMLHRHAQNVERGVWALKAA